MERQEWNNKTRKMQSTEQIDAFLRKRTFSRRRVREDKVPPLVTLRLDSTVSTNSSAPSESTSNDWDKVYTPPPLFSQSSVLIVGCFIFVLATIYPPLILLLAYIASKLIPYSFRVNDDAASRRRLFADFTKQDDLPDEFKRLPSHIQLEESYWVNSRGMALCTTIMLPKHKPIRAVVCFCHGYTDHVSFMKQVEYQRLVNEGIAFVAVEYEGHGRSDGALGLINDWNSLIDDVSSFFKEISQTRFAGKAVFLMGESMGGAVAYCTYKRIPQLFRGVVFVCPMCKISDDMLPPQWVVNSLIWLIGPSGSTSLLGYLPIAPAKQNVGEVANKLEEKRILNGRAPLNYERNPRLATARELIKATQTISSSLAEFDARFLVIHGKDDRVTDPKLSQSLYEESKSKDKSLKLYDGMWHGLTSTEPDENIDKVFDDAIEWILHRS